MDAKIRFSRFIPSLLFILASLTLPLPASAQLDRLLDRIGGAVEREVSNTVTDIAVQTTRCALGNSRCIEEAKEKGEEVVYVDADGNEIPPDRAEQMLAEQNMDAMEEPGEGVWRNYDFTPGKRVIYASDFDRARVGRIPRDIRFVSGNMQIVELNGEKVLEVVSNAVFEIVLDEPLPESFALEYQGKSALPNVAIDTYFEAFSEPRLAYQSYPHHYLHVRGESGLRYQGNMISSMSGLRHVSDEIVDVKFQYDYGYAIMYINTDRVAQIPNASIPVGSNVIEFSVNANSNYPAYIKNISISYDIDDPYDALMEEGEFTTRGILFDVGQSRLRPESTTVLIRILEMMVDYEDLNIIIEGHTDADGDEASNQALSEDRAESVRQWLISQGIEDSRMRAVGLGESMPVADNNTVAGKQQNRRVVLRLE